MSKKTKVTGKMLKDLILEVLQETEEEETEELPPNEDQTVYNSLMDLEQALPAPVFNNLRNALSRVLKFDDLKKLTEVASKLEPADFEKFFDDFDDNKKIIKRGEEENAIETIRKAVIDAYNTPNLDDAAKQSLAMILKFSQELDDIRVSSGSTTGYSMTTSTGQQDKNLNPQIFRSFELSFKASDLKGRLLELQEIVNRVKSGNMGNRTISEKFANFIVLEVLSAILFKEEASSAGTIFESFCAFMAFGGEAIGAENGMADFQWTQSGKKKLGSAKLLRKGAQTSQQLGKMTKSGVNSRMTYVVGYKTTSGAATTQQQTPDQIDFYLFDVINKDGKIYMTHHGGTSTTIPLGSGKVIISPTHIQKFPVASLDLSGINLGNFDDHSDEMIKNISSNLLKLLNGFSDLKSNMDNYLLSYDTPEERIIYSDQAINEYNNLKRLMTTEQLKALEESKKVDFKMIIESFFGFSEAKKKKAKPSTGVSLFYNPDYRYNLLDQQTTETAESKGVEETITSLDASRWANSIIKFEGDMAKGLFAAIFRYKSMSTGTSKNFSDYKEDTKNSTKFSELPLARTLRYIAVRSIYDGDQSLIQDFKKCIKSALGDKFFPRFEKKGLNQSELPALANQLISKMGSDDVKIPLIKREVSVPTSTNREQGPDSGYTLTSRSGSERKVDFQIVRAFENLFGKQGRFEEKVRKLTDYMESVGDRVSNGQSVGGSIDDKFSGFIVLDVLSQILYDQDATVAGWIFESFLAFMVGGTAIGTGYGAADFTFSDGKAGSAKFLSETKSSQNFEDLADGEEIRYVFGVKSSFQPKEGGFNLKATTKQTNTGLLEIYVADAIKSESKIILKDFYSGESKEFEISADRADINVEGFNPQIIDLTFMQELNFEQISGAVVSDISEEVNKSLVLLKNCRDNLNSYVLQGEIANANDSIKNFKELEKNLLPSDPSKEIFSMNESKKVTPNLLKKLISENFKK